MEMAATLPLQEFFVTSHGDDEGVNNFIAKIFCCIQNNQVFVPQVLYFCLHSRQNIAEGLFKSYCILSKGSMES